MEDKDKKSVEEKKAPTKKIFCAYDQKVTPHTGEVDGNGEFVFTCECGRFVKFPSDIVPGQFQELVSEHKAQNVGQVSIEEQEAKLKALFGDDEDEDEEDAKEDKEKEEDTPKE